ncbi:MAG: DnaJ domain-containing protein, partial [Candidatus Dormibacteraceae bacterium]
MPDHYTLLGVVRSATTTEIKAAYRRLVAQYHPDLNPDPQASNITATLNEAFAVLSDEDKRKAYDEELDATELRPTAPAAANWKAPSESFLRTRCQNCGRQDSSLRYSQFSHTVSFLVVSSSRTVAGVWCERCRVAESAKWSLLSGFAGWWGIPFGPFRTIRDLVLNSRGGRKPGPRNAALLRSLGYDLYGRANYDEAVRALQQSIRFEPNVEANAVLDQLQSRIQPVTLQSRASSLWTLALATPALVVALIWACIIYTATLGVGTYRASRQSPQALIVQSSLPPASVQQIVSLKVKRLASLIATRSPRVGFHHEGSTLVTDYGVDRSRYDA